MDSKSSEQECHESGENQHARSVEQSTANDARSAEPAGNNALQPKSQAYWEQRQFRVQRLIAYAGVLGLIVYGLQLWEMRKSTDAATNAALSAKEGLTIARASVQLEQRAWVAVVVEHPIPEVGKIFKVTVVAKNTGKTFARKFKLFTVFQKVNKDDPVKFVYGKWGEGTAPSGGSLSLLAPGGEYRTTGIEVDMRFDPDSTALPEPVTQDQLDEMRKGGYSLFVYGKLTYTDIFNCEHWTTFCSELMPKGLDWKACSEHNDADENDCLEVDRKNVTK